jgi:hypothetical protein
MNLFGAYAQSYDAAFFRFYGPTEAYFDKTWKLEDIVAVRQ